MSYFEFERGELKENSNNYVIDSQRSTNLKETLS